MRRLIKRLVCWWIRVCPDCEQSLCWCGCCPCMPHEEKP